LKGTIEFTSE
jgi:hypothetical protein